MKYVELKIHPGQKYRVDDKEYRDLRSLGLVVGVEDEVAETGKTESAPVTTPKRKASNKKTSQEEAFVTSEDTTEGQTGSDE